MIDSAIAAWLRHISATGWPAVDTVRGQAAGQPLAPRHGEAVAADAALVVQRRLVLTARGGGLVAARHRGTPSGQAGDLARHLVRPPGGDDTRPDQGARHAQRRGSRVQVLREVRPSFAGRPDRCRPTCAQTSLTRLRIRPESTPRQHHLYDQLGALSGQRSQLDGHPLLVVVGHAPHDVLFRPVHDRIEPEGDHVVPVRTHPDQASRATPDVSLFDDLAPTDLRHEPGVQLRRVRAPAIPGPVDGRRSKRSPGLRLACVSSPLRTQDPRRSPGDECGVAHDARGRAASPHPHPKCREPYQRTDVPLLLRMIDRIVTVNAHPAVVRRRGVIGAGDSFGRA